MREPKRVPADPAALAWAVLLALLMAAAGLESTRALGKRFCGGFNPTSAKPSARTEDR